MFSSPDEEFSLPLPCIVKPLSEDASIGIDKKESVATTVEAVRKRVAYLTKKYPGPCLAEVFIDGREFSVAVWGNEDPICLPIVEMDLSFFPKYSFA